VDVDRVVLFVLAGMLAATAVAIVYVVMNL
jgi:hypothetical protein